jgi:hypothetical protein
MTENAEPSDADKARANRARRRAIDPPEVIRAELALLEGESAYRRALAETTPTQQRRAKEHLSGKSVRAIAKEEGRAPSTVSESLTAPSVRALIAAQLRLMSANGEPVFLAALRELASIALGAQRPGPFGMVPDNRVRLDAILKLLHYYDPSDGDVPALAPGKTKFPRAPLSLEAPEPTSALPTRDFVEQAVIERSITAQERRTLTRTKPERS